jgi:hypothetical protein
MIVCFSLTVDVFKDKTSRKLKGRRLPKLGKEGKDQGLAGHVCWVCGRRSGPAFDSGQNKRCYRCESRNCQAIICANCAAKDPFQGCPFCFGPVREIDGPKGDMR